MTNQHHTLNYVEFAARDLTATKQFFSGVFGWTFEDYGADYSAFSGAGMNGGFFKAELAGTTEVGAALLVIFSNDLEQTLAQVIAAGGKVTKPIFSFPGGRRFHFAEPSGNELAVWSE